MSKMLELNPWDRVTALEALADPYFDGMREPDIEELVQKHLQANRAGSKSRGGHSW